MVNNYRDIIKSYFTENPLVESNINSFNAFTEKGIQKVVDEIGDIIPTVIPQEVNSYLIKLKKAWLEKPTLTEADGSKRDIYPSEARLRKLTYAGTLFIEVSAIVDGILRESFVTTIGKVPIMLKSKLCHLNSLKRDDLIKHGEDPDDQGGYFIINGNERALITVEDLASNKLFVEKKESGPSEYVGKIFSEMGYYRVPHTIEQMKDGLIYLTFTRFRRVQVIAVIKALGLTKDSEITKAIAGDKTYDSIFINLYDSIELKSEEDALEFLARKIGITQPRNVKIERSREQLDKYFLPHLGTKPKDRIIKAYNLCKIIRKFLMVVEDNYKVLSKDHYINKRLKLSGELMEDLLRINLRTLVQDVLYNFQRLVKRGKFQSIRIIVREELLTSNIKSALATGSWTGGRKGISQNIDRTNILSYASHMNRVVSLLTTTQENFEARAIHSTHYGRLCPIETPEGTSIGLRKNLALLCSISQEGVTEEKLKKMLEGSGVKFLEK